MSSSSIRHHDAVRLGLLVAVAVILSGACSGDSSGVRSFDLEGHEYHGDGRPEGPDMPYPWESIEAVVIEAPTVVTVGDEVHVVVELRNPNVQRVELDPCPV